MNKVELIHGCYQVGCHLAFEHEGKVLEGVVSMSGTLYGDILLVVEVGHDSYELCVSNGDAVIVGPLYREAA
jgi:hypothetical protein